MRLIAAVLLAVAAAAAAGAAPQAAGAAEARKLNAVAAPDHDPLFVDAASVQRRGAAVTFRYVLDVASGHEGNAGWKSNEIEAVIDCTKRTYAVRRVTAYPGPRATGIATAVHSFMAPAPRPERIAPRSTFAYLEHHLCLNADGASRSAER